MVNSNSMVVLCADQQRTNAVFQNNMLQGAFCDNFGATVITVIIFKVFLINKLLACWHNLPPDLPPTAFGSEIQGLWPSLSFTGPETSIWEPSWPSCLILGFIVPRCCSACYKCYSELKIQSPNVLEASVRPHSFRQTKRQVVHKVSRRSTQIAEFWCPNLDRILTETFGPAWENSLQLVAWTEWTEHTEIHWAHFLKFHVRTAYSLRLIMRCPRCLGAQVTRLFLLGSRAIGFWLHGPSPQRLSSRLEPWISFLRPVQW